MGKLIKLLLEVKKKEQQKGWMDGTKKVLKVYSILCGGKLL